MAENYDLIFGQSASQQYAWSDSDYQNGWQTVGSTPPTAEQFDALQRKSDTKAKDLNDRLEPLETKAEADGRQASTAYTAGTMVTVDGLPNGWLLECVVPGNSGAGAITLPPTLIDGLTIVDDEVTWKLRKVATNGGLGYRQPNTTYTVGAIAYHSALPTGWYLKCTTAGTTDSGDLTISSPAIGGTVSDGTVVWTMMPVLDAVGRNRYKDFELININDDSFFAIYGGNGAANGGALKLYGQAHPDNPSESRLVAASNTNGINEADLVIKPDGTMVFYPTLGQNYVNWDVAGSAIVAKSLGSNGYIKYASGLIVQWGQVKGQTGVQYYDIYFPVTFSSQPICNVTLSSGNNIYANLVSLTTNKGTVRCSGTPDSIKWFAIGY